MKWRRRLASQTLVRLATAITALGFLPGAVGLIYNGWKMRLQPYKEGDSAKDKKTSSDVGGAEVGRPAPILPLLPYALLTSSMSFFLFSFQVHEKTILLPLLPLTLLLSGVTSHEASETWEIGMLASNVALFRCVRVGHRVLRGDAESAVQYVAPAQTRRSGRVIHRHDDTLESPRRLQPVPRPANLAPAVPLLRMSSPSLHPRAL